MCVALSAIGLRAFEMTPSAPNLVRLLFSIVTLALVFVAPYRTLVRRAAFALVFEAIVGTTAFAIIDVPLVADHRAQIGAVAIAISERVVALESRR